MHEVIYLHLTRVSPTWEVTWFFVLQGVCTAAKKAVAGMWQLHRVVSGLLTLTGVLQIINNGVDLKAMNEYSKICVSFLGSK